MGYENKIPEKGGGQGNEAKCMGWRQKSREVWCKNVRVITKRATKTKKWRGGGQNVQGKNEGGMKTKNGGGHNANMYGGGIPNWDKIRGRVEEDQKYGGGYMYKDTKIQGAWGKNVGGGLCRQEKKMGGGRGLRQTCRGYTEKNYKTKNPGRGVIRQKCRGWAMKKNRRRHGV